MEDISNFGEINQILEYASKKLNWNQIRRMIKNKIEIRNEYSDVKRNQVYKSLAYLTTIIFGLIGALALVDKVTIPLWNILNLPIPPDPNVKLLIYSVITIIIIILVIVLSWRIIVWKIQKPKIMK